MLQKNREILWNNTQDVWSKLKDKHIFLTGGTGYFGKSFLELINLFNSDKGLNLKITILARNPSKFKKDFPLLSEHSWIEFIEGEIETFTFYKFKIDFILHFANPASRKLNQEYPLEIFDIIHLGTRRVLEFAKFCQVTAVLQTSSGAVYGNQPDEMTHIPENYAGAPRTSDLNSGYGEGKRVAELIGNIYSSTYGFDHKIARCFAFVGPFLDPNGSYAIGNFIRDAVTTGKIVINGDGTDYRSYMFSDDLVVALLKILILGKNHQPYNVGSEQEITIKDLAGLVLKLVNEKGMVEIKKQKILGKAPNRYVPDIQMLQSELNFKESTSLSDAIRSTANYYKNILS